MITVFNATALRSAMDTAGEAGEAGLLSVFDSAMPVERQFSAETVSSIMLSSLSNIEKEQKMRDCHTSKQTVMHKQLGCGTFV